MAYSFTEKKCIRKDFGKGFPLEQSLIKEIYGKMFSPTVEAGLLQKEQLTQYRDIPVYIRRSRYVPPNYQLVEPMMAAYVEEINRIENPSLRALMAHYGFATVHPYQDGNGRLARLLMNYVLGVSGFPWATIRKDDQQEYFHALEIGQVDGSLMHFARFIREYFKKAYKDLRKKALG